MASNDEVPRGAQDLQQYVLTNVRRSGRSIGSGSYGSVEEIEVNGVICAAKKLHDVLLQPSNQGAASVREKFVEECRMMSKLIHPHIVQFLGVFYSSRQCSSEIPWLVMEFLHSSLDNILLKRGRIPFPLKVSFMFDVSKGLAYLHNQKPAVIHRDLTARNVLINSAMVAKIADFGVSRFVHDCITTQERFSQMTRVPGNSVYMPPEASNESNTQYSSKLDIFSFGVLTLYCIAQKLPFKLKPATYVSPSNPHEVLGRTEVERRQDYFEMAVAVSDPSSQLEQALLQLSRACLHNDPAQRPDSELLLTKLKEVDHHCNTGLMKKDKLELMMDITTAQTEAKGLNNVTAGSEKADHEEATLKAAPQRSICTAISTPSIDVSYQTITECTQTQRHKSPLSPRRMTRSKSALYYEQIQFHDNQAHKMQKSALADPTGWYNAILFTPHCISDLSKAWKAVFIVSRSDMFCGQPIQSFLESVLRLDALFPTSQKFQFACGDCVTLHIPHTEALAQGYKINADTSPCRFTKSEVDDIGKDFLSYPPRRILTVRPAGGGRQLRQRLEVELTLLGGEEPCQFQLETPEYAPATPFFTIGPPHGQEDHQAQDLTQKQAKFLESKPDRAKFMDLVGCRIPPGKWKLYATQLGLSDRETNEIEFTSTGLTNPPAIFLEVFNRWEKSLKPRHTWNEVLEALESNSVNETSLACEIGKQLLTDSSSALL